MSYQTLEEVTGVGKTITIRNKRTGVPFRVGEIEEEVFISDGEQKYFVQWVRLQPNVSVEGDDTRYVLRIGYYTQRTDSAFCLGSQFTPILTPSECQLLLAAIVQKECLKGR
jgi:hypothetical protein